MVRSRQERKRSADMRDPEPGPRNAARQRVMSARVRLPHGDLGKAGATGRPAASAKSSGAGSRPRVSSRKVAALPPPAPTSASVSEGSGCEIEVDLDMDVEPAQIGTEAASIEDEERHRVRAKEQPRHACCVEANPALHRAGGRGMC